ncbi:hypothetical protein V8F20_011784 [Naviculisporaceae sp. PSN 640]
MARVWNLGLIKAHLLILCHGITPTVEEVTQPWRINRPPTLPRHLDLNSPRSVTIAKQASGCLVLCDLETPSRSP